MFPAGNQTGFVRQHNSYLGRCPSAVKDEPSNHKAEKRMFGVVRSLFAEFCSCLVEKLRDINLGARSVGMQKQRRKTAMNAAKFSITFKLLPHSPSW